MLPPPSLSPLPLPQSLPPPVHYNRMILTDLTVDIPGSHRAPPLETPETTRLRPTSRSRWKTTEFRIYTVIACIVIPIMVWIPVSLSQPSHPNYGRFKNRLSPGWIPFRKVDNSDAQYRGFRNNIWLLTLLAGLYLCLKLAYVRFAGFKSRTGQNAATASTPTSSASFPSQTTTETAAETDDTNDTSYLRLVGYNLAFSTVFIIGLHGAGVFKVFAILGINFFLARLSSSPPSSSPRLSSAFLSRVGPGLAWAFNVAILFANDRYNGYQFGEILPSLAFLDSYKGVYPRWHIIFNITMLRLLSFNMDYHWACRDKVKESGNENTKRQQYNTTVSAVERQRTSHPLPMYNFATYASYILYPPLYIAGPIMTFNDYLSQLRRPTHISTRTVTLYAIRLCASLLTMEFVLHFMYVVAIKDTKAWMGDTPAQVCMIGFWNLVVVWLKLLIPWRFFRLWALADGIDAPENMVRCVANNYSTLGFWRSWHRSYNLWIVRYIYIPLGGSKHLLRNTVLVFTFVALWHDLTFRLLAWGWLVSLFILPEVIASHVFPATSKFALHPWYRHVCVLGGVVNVLMMMGANLVGFVIGTDGIQFFVRQLFGTTQGLAFFGVACTCLFIGVQLMVEYREEEKRMGIYRRC